MTTGEIIMIIKSNAVPVLLVSIIKSTGYLHTLSQV